MNVAVKWVVGGAVAATAGAIAVRGVRRWLDDAPGDVFDSLVNRASNTVVQIARVAGQTVVKSVKEFTGITRDGESLWDAWQSKKDIQAGVERLQQKATASVHEMLAERMRKSEHVRIMDMLRAEFSLDSMKQPVYGPDYWSHSDPNLDPVIQ